MMAHGYFLKMTHRLSKSGTMDPCACFCLQNPCRDQLLKILTCIMRVFGSCVLGVRLHKTFSCDTLFIGRLHNYYNIELILLKSGALRDKMEWCKRWEKCSDQIKDKIGAIWYKLNIKKNINIINRKRKQNGRGLKLQGPKCLWQYHHRAVIKICWAYEISRRGMEQRSCK